MIKDIEEIENHYNSLYGKNEINDHYYYAENINDFEDCYSNEDDDYNNYYDEIEYDDYNEEDFEINKIKENFKFDNKSLI